MKEQWEEWKKMLAETDRKVWIVTGIVILGLVIVVLLMFSLFGGTKQEQDALCPYRWEQKDSGELVLEIDSSAVGNVTWTAERAEDAEEKVSCEIKTSGHKSRCTFRGTEMGITQIILSCQRTEPITESVCSIELSLSVDGDLAVDVVEASETENICFVKLDAETKYSCYYLPLTETENSPLEIRIEQAGNSEWSYRTEGDVTVGAAEQFEGTLHLELFAREAQGTEVAATESETTAEVTDSSEAGVLIYNTAENIQYTFTITVMSDHTLRVTDAAVESCEYTQDEGNTFRSWDALLNAAGE